MPEFHNLSFNPFYERHDHKLVGKNRKQLMTLLIDETENALDAGSPFILTLLGGIGLGKSFTLRELSMALGDPKNFHHPKRVISAKFDATVAGPPSRYIEYLFHSMMRAIGKETFEALRSEFESQSRNHHDPLEDLEKNFQKAFLSFGKHKNQSIVWNWLTGERTDLRELKKLGIVSKIDNPSSALDAFTSFSILLQKLGYAGTFLAIDEAEELALSGTSQVIRALTQIKKIFEQNKNLLSRKPPIGTPIILCLAFTPGTYRLITGARTAERETERTGSAGLQTFLRRIGREYFIDPLTSEDMEELIKVFLNKARGKQIDSIEPFNKDSTKYLTKISNGVPGYVIGYAQELLKRADENKQKTIDAKTAQEWLVKAGMIPVEGITPVEGPTKEVEF